jgi:hypothetical protein
VTTVPTRPTRSVPRSDRGRSAHPEAAARRTEVEQLRMAAHDEVVDVTVVLPVYNEVGHIEEELARTVAASRPATTSTTSTSTTTARPTAPATSSSGSTPPAPTRGCATSRGPATAAPAPSGGSARRRPRAHRGLDRRRHDLPERAHPRVRPDARRRPVLRPGRRRAHLGGGHLQAAARPGEVDDPQDRVVPHRHEDPGPEQRAAGVPPRGGRCPTCRCCRRASPASRR